MVKAVTIINFGKPESTIQFNNTISTTELNTPTYISKCIPGGRGFNTQEIPSAIPRFQCMAIQSLRILKILHNSLNSRGFQRNSLMHNVKETFEYLGMRRRERYSLNSPEEVDVIIHLQNTDMFTHVQLTFDTSPGWSFQTFRIVCT